MAMEAYVEYGIAGQGLETSVKTAAAGASCEFILDCLVPGAEYGCRLRYRLAGSEDPYDEGSFLVFRTQCPPLTPFTFTIQADSHIIGAWQSQGPGIELYRRALENIEADRPEFHISMGDFAMIGYCPSRSMAWEQYAVQRRFLDTHLSGVPLYLVLGNHEVEMGWLMAAGDSLPVWGETARRELILNPGPDRFYEGCEDPPATGEGHRESYFAWEWGDAFIVVLDPYWYTVRDPVNDPDPELRGGWAWTLGIEQYEWLHEVLNGTDRQWKIVCIHHLVGGVDDETGAYGRGGIETVDYAVAGRPSFEWGGEDSLGADAFAEYRPGWWHGPVHDLLRTHGVDLVLHGHDHFFAFQEWDGIAYVTVPQVSDASYGYGFMAAGGYEHGVLLPNAGHLRCQVSPGDVTIEYVRAFLDGDGTNGEVAASFSLATMSANGVNDSRDALHLRAEPNPAVRQTAFWLQSPGGSRLPAGEELRVFDAMGRLRARIRPDVRGGYAWDHRDLGGRLVPPGTYFGMVGVGESRHTRRLTVIR